MEHYALGFPTVQERSVAFVPRLLAQTLVEETDQASATVLSSLPVGLLVELDTGFAR